LTSGSSARIQRRLGRPTRRQPPAGSDQHLQLTLTVLVVGVCGMARHHRQPQPISRMSVRDEPVQANMLDPGLQFDRWIHVVAAEGVALRDVSGPQVFGVAHDQGEGCGSASKANPRVRLG
jgi:hypothetical protein